MYFFIIIVATSLAAAGARAQPIADEAQIRRDCRADALRHCPLESMRCLRKETSECRGAVIACMVKNKSRLRPRCAAHIR